MFQELKFSTYYQVIASELRAALSRYYDTWIEVLCREEANRASDISRVEQRRISVIVLTSALLEHTINFYFCTKCTAAEFLKIERKAFLDKWTLLPKRFIPAYELSASAGLEKELRALVERRVSIVHAKPRLSIDGDNRHEGNEPAIQLDETVLMESCATMPFRLVENLLSFDRDAFISMSSIRISCGTVGQELGGALRRFDYVKRMPEELVNEIMAQGHCSDRAKLFAALIGPVPSRWFDRSIPVHRHGEIVAVLKPLKFFASTGFVLDSSDPTIQSEKPLIR